MGIQSAGAVRYTLNKRVVSLRNAWWIMQIMLHPAHKPSQNSKHQKILTTGNTGSTGIIQGMSPRYP